MSMEAAVMAGRRAAEQTMLDTGTASRPTGEGWRNDPVLQREVLDADVLFTGSPCKVQTRNVMSSTVEVGARTATEVRTELHLPAASAPLTTGDLFEFTAVHPLSLTVVGARVRVLAPVAGTFKTAARYVVEEIL